MEKTTHSAEEGVTEKCARTDRSNTEMDTEGGGEAGTSQSHLQAQEGTYNKHLPNRLR